MASLFAIAGGALLNAFAFTGTNYLFSKLKHSNAEEERKRYYQAVTETQKKQAKWQKERQKKLDLYNKYLQDQNESQRYISEIDEAAHQYYLATKQVQDPFPPKPEITDFYNPSDAQKNGEIGFLIIGMTIVGVVAYQIKKNVKKT